MAAPGTTYQQQAYGFVKARITEFALKPGEYIQDTQIASELKISRTPVREAFHRLENEGLLVYEARRGWKVYTLSLEDIREIFDVKIVVEGMVARRAAESRNEELQEALRNTVQRMQQADQADDIDSWLEADARFHDIVFTMAGNARARRITANLNDQWHRLRIGFVTMKGRIKQSVGEHEGIADAILTSDADQAEFRMRSHLTNVRDDLISLLTNLVLPFAANGV
jgi:GntR family transcriptional regulator, rspAB operon transcriptional repressor